MNPAGGFLALLQQIVGYFSDAFHDPSTLLRLGIWGALGVCALVLVLFVIPVGLLCLAYYMISRSQKQKPGSVEETVTKESTEEMIPKDAGTSEQ